MASSGKIIVTNVGALRAKYGAKTDLVLAAVNNLVAADAQRGLATTLVDIGSSPAMKAVRGKAVAKSGDERATKAAIDAVFRAKHPDYVVILGAPDVVAQQTLDNPVPSGGSDGDPDHTVPSDLPYACEAAYGRAAASFLAPTRVVGRIPDLVGAKGDPQFVVGLLSVAAAARSGTARDYASCFGVSASVWEKSTALSLRNLFGSDGALQLSPPKGPAWPASTYRKHAHFINCHGADADPHFYGQRGAQFPIAFDAAKMPGKGLGKVLVAAECCYGGQLYDPALSGGQPNVACTYLRAGAYAFFGSSTVAYGPAEGNGSADLICQYFLHAAMTGASTGRATLEARQRFIQQASPLDPTDLKTIAQYVLLGDPSIEPVAVAAPKAFAALLAPDKARTLRREALAKSGSAIGAVAGSARHAPRVRPPRKVMSALRAEVGGAAPETTIASYTVDQPQLRPPAGAKGMAAAAAAQPTSAPRIHVAVRRHRGTSAKHLRLTIVVATELDGEVAKLRRLESR